MRNHDQGNESDQGAGNQLISDSVSDIDAIGVRLDVALEVLQEIQNQLARCRRDFVAHARNAPVSLPTLDNRQFPPAGLDEDEEDPHGGGNDAPGISIENYALTANCSTEIVWKMIGDGALSTVRSSDGQIQIALREGLDFDRIGPRERARVFDSDAAVDAAVSAAMTNHDHG